MGSLPLESEISTVRVFPIDGDKSMRNIVTVYYPSCLDIDIVNLRELTPALSAGMFEMMVVRGQPRN